MELWVRSQDKNILLKVDKIEICHNYTQKVKNENYLPKGSISYDSMKTISTYVNDKYIDSNIYVNGKELGTYKSKERASEVLDEIQDEISTYVGTMAQIVYEMPKE